MIETNEYKSKIMDKNLYDSIKKCTDVKKKNKFKIDKCNSENKKDEKPLNKFIYS